jgi:hypothetical protein
MYYFLQLHVNLKFCESKSLIFKKHQIENLQIIFQVNARKGMNEKITKLHIKTNETLFCYKIPLNLHFGTNDSKDAKNHCTIFDCTTETK